MTAPTPGPDEAALARAAAAGDEKAFAALVSLHKQPIYRLLRRYLGDPDEAYEAAHEAFIAAWRALHRYDPGQPFGAWLRTIAINKARDRGRRLAVRRLLFAAAPADADAPLAAGDPGRDPEQALADAQDLSLIDRAVSALPAALKAPFLLMAVEGLSRRQTAKILGVTEKAVDTRVYRARKRLAKALDLPG